MYLIGSGKLLHDGEEHFWSWSWRDDQQHGPHFAQAIPQDTQQNSALITLDFGCRCTSDEVPPGTTSRRRWTYYCTVRRVKKSPVNFREEGTGQYYLYGGTLV
jgi:hypothetical protein